jgi:predicted fused transcriptional regulator/phosphomethylpyrimidine kinase
VSYSRVSWALLFAAALLPFGAMPAPVFGETPPAPAKERAVLYEESAENSDGSSNTVGTVVWRIERVAAAPGQKPDIVVYADVDIPKKLTVRWSIQRTDDRELPSSHLIKVQFTEPAGSAHGVVINMPSVVLKADETGPEARLAGMSVKVAENFFLVGLTAADADRKRNIELLKQRPWVEVPVMFADAKRAFVLFDEGAEGKRVLAEAFDAWEGGK